MCSVSIDVLIVNYHFVESQNADGGFMSAVQPLAGALDADNGVRVCYSKNKDRSHPSSYSAQQALPLSLSRTANAQFPPDILSERTWNQRYIMNDPPYPTTERSPFIYDSDATKYETLC